MKGKSILIVDDEQTILDCLSRDLKGAGLKVTTAVDGEEAIAKINTGLFDLVTTDLLMPVCDGFQVVKAAKEMDPRTMVIVLTGNETSEAAVNAFHLGADDFVQKPCDSDELLCRISNCFEKQELLKKITRYEQLLPAWCQCQKLRSDRQGVLNNDRRYRQEDCLNKAEGVDASHTCRCPECYAEQIKSSLGCEEQ